MAVDPQINAIIRGLERVGERVVKKITLDLTANLIESTPVLTGWAQANWVPSIGTPHEGVAGSPDGVEQATQQAGQAAVAASYTLPRGSVYVSNNVPYVVKLNAGSSSKEPAGFVERAVTKAATRDIIGVAD